MQRQNIIIYDGKTAPFTFFQDPWIYIIFTNK